MMRLKRNDEFILLDVDVFDLLSQSDCKVVSILCLYSFMVVDP